MEKIILISIPTAARAVNWMAELYSCALGSLRHRCGCENGYKLQHCLEKINSGVSNQLCRLLPHLLGQHWALALLIYLLQNHGSIFFHSFMEFVVFSVYCLFPDAVVYNCISVAIISLFRCVCDTYEYTITSFSNVVGWRELIKTTTSTLKVTENIVFTKEISVENSLC